MMLCNLYKINHLCIRDLICHFYLNKQFFLLCLTHVPIKNKFMINVPKSIVDMVAMLFDSSGQFLVIIQMNVNKFM